MPHRIFGHFVRSRHSLSMNTVSAILRKETRLHCKLVLWHPFDIFWRKWMVSVCIHLLWMGVFGNSEYNLPSCRISLVIFSTTFLYVKNSDSSSKWEDLDTLHVTLMAPNPGSGVGWYWRTLSDVCPDTSGSMQGPVNKRLKMALPFLRCPYALKRDGWRR